MEILTRCRSEIPKNIETKIGMNDYDPTTLPFFVEFLQWSLLPMLLKYVMKKIILGNAPKLKKN